MKKYTWVHYLLIMLTVLALAGCASKAETSDRTANKPAANKNEQSSGDVPNLKGDDWEYLALYDGLHITGEPIYVDTESYNLEITGMVENELSLSFEDIKSMESVRKEITLTCPGFFADKGYWTGVPLATILEQAGVKETAVSVIFSAVDESYSSEIPMHVAMQDGTLVSFQFDDEEFHPYHGYPLRMVVEGEPGSRWVKWLGKIYVR